jgi:hypothetical protein
VAVISLSGNWIYIHIPKNGGAAAASYLRFHVGVGHVVMEDGFPPEELASFGIEKHAPADRIAAWVRSIGRRWEQFTSFATIRDPLTRPESVFWEIRHSWPLWQGRVTNGWDIDSPEGREWWNRFKVLRDVNEFVESGLYDPDGPFYMTFRQRWYLTPGCQVHRDAQPLTTHLVPMDRASTEIPAMIGNPGEMLPWAHAGGYERTPLSGESRRLIAEKYPLDIELYERIGRS